MHATKLITPEILLTMCIGGIIFVLVFRALMKPPKR